VARRTKKTNKSEKSTATVDFEAKLWAAADGQRELRLGATLPLSSRAERHRRVGARERLDVVRLVGCALDRLIELGLVV
jgi:hypothetical protein